MYFSEQMRAILIMEAYLNHPNKEIFGFRMLENERKYGFIPEEVYIERSKTADEETLNKVRFEDNVRQTRLTAGIASFDTDNCYDSVAHAIASLVFQAYGVPEEVVQSMLSTIEEMNYYLRTAYGDSKNYRGHKISVKFQGLCQGNGAAPAEWAVLGNIQN